MSTEIRKLNKEGVDFYPLTHEDAVVGNDGRTIGQKIATVDYDISANHNGATYADLATALGTNGANVPATVRRGGMSVRFINSDGKYDQWRYMGTSITNANFANVANWQGVDDEPTEGSNNLVKSGGVHNSIVSLTVHAGITVGKEALTVKSFWNAVSGVGAIVTQGHNVNAGCMLLEMKEGDVINIVSHGNTIAPPLIFVDNEFRALAIPSTTSINGDFTAPANTTYACINLYTTSYNFSVYIKNTTIAEIENQINSVKYLNLIELEDTVSGWYNINGNFTQNDNFIAISQKLEINSGSRYVYTGAMFNLLALVIFDENDNIIKAIRADNIQSIGIVNRYTYNEAETRIIMVDFTVPSDATKILISAQKGNLPLGLYEVQSSRTMAGNEVLWTIPNKFYAIKGLEKSIYIDNIVNRNEDAPNYCLEVNKSFGDVDGRRFYFTPDAVGNKSVIFDAWNANNKKIDSKTISLEVLNNELSSSKRICCIGDSITEKENMPYYIQQCLLNTLTSESIQPEFVGTRGGTSGMGNKPTKHEGRYGRNYVWLATNASSPFVNNGVLDIYNYRTVKLGLAENQYIDVVSLAMGFNATNTEQGGLDSFAAMQDIISAFKADNANTKFIVHLVTYPAMGNVLQPDNEEKIAKKNSLYFFRKLCLDAYNNNQDPNIVIGDLGLGYDRFYAYEREQIHPASYYQNDYIQIVIDRVHPTVDGTKQMGENIAAVILKALQS